MRVLGTGMSGFVGFQVVRGLIARGGHEIAAWLHPERSPWRIGGVLDPIRRIDGEVPFPPDQLMNLGADVSQLREATRWSPVVDLDEDLRRMIAWFRKHGGA